MTSICMLSPTFGMVDGDVVGGGVNHAVFYMSAELAELGCDVTILTSNSAQRSSPVKGLEVISVSGNYGLKSFLQTMGKSFEIIHSHHSRCLLHETFGRMRPKRSKIVVHVHWTPLNPMNIVTRLRLVYALADMIVTPSLGNVLRLTRYCSTRPEKTAVIPNGVQTDKFKFSRQQAENLKLRLGLEDRRIILFVGHYAAPSKGIEHLILASPKVIKQFPDVTFLLVGNPAEDEREKLQMARLTQLIKKFGIEQNVRFLDFVPHSRLPAFYSMADIFVQPSLVESFGMPAIEAMACERPVIATTVGGMPDVITPYFDGILVNPSDPEALSQAMYNILSDGQLAVKIGRNAGMTIVNKYSWRAVARKLKDLYEEIL